MRTCCARADLVISETIVLRLMSDKRPPSLNLVKFPMINRDIFLSGIKVSKVTVKSSFRQYPKFRVFVTSISIF